MKKMRAFGAVLAMILSSGVTPVFAVSAGLADGEAVEVSGASGGSEMAAVAEVSGVDAGDANDSALSLAVAQAEQALLVTANVPEVAGVRAYLQGLVAQAQSLDFAKLSTAEQKELLAALNEGARGLRALAGVDRKESSNSASDNTAAVVGSGSVTSGAATGSAVASGVARVTNVAVAQAMDAPVAGDVAVAVEVSSASGASGSEFATLALAQVKKTSGVTLAAAELDGVEVPKTGASEEDAQQTSNAVRGMGLVLGGAVVLAAAAGAVLIVKRMKRGL